MTKRIGQWTQTFSGRMFWPLDPRPEEVAIEDIAHALSMICRYNGHSRFFYSVAQHSVLVSHHVPAEHALWGLMHDAHEAYVGDMVRPLKGGAFHALHPNDIADDAVSRSHIEERIQDAICHAFGMPMGEPREVKRIDMAILGNEMRDLMAPPPEPWDLPEPPIPGLTITSWSPEYAEEMFIRRFHELRGARG